MTSENAELKNEREKARNEKEEMEARINLLQSSIPKILLTPAIQMTVTPRKMKEPNRRATVANFMQRPPAMGAGGALGGFSPVDKRKQIFSQFLIRSWKGVPVPPPRTGVIIT